MTLCAGGGRSRDIFLELAVREIVREELAAVEARRAMAADVIAGEPAPPAQPDAPCIIERLFAEAEGFDIWGGEAQ